jgi:hypothetical protein
MKEASRQQNTMATGEEAVAFGESELLVHHQLNDWLSSNEV